VARGRTRQFDVDEALDRALEVFWRKGYEGATLPDLTSAMEINRPSLYAAFGNKEGLFRRALDRYDQRCRHMQRSLDAPTARGVAQRLLRSAADALTDPKRPRGCLMVQGALSCGDSAEPVRLELCSRRASVETALRRRFERARNDGDLGPDADPAELAMFLVTVVNGMAVQAAGGAARRALRSVGEMALRSWPGSHPPRPG